MSKMNPEFLREIEVENFLDGDVQMIANRIGMETVIKLWEYFGGMHLYISHKPIRKAIKAYIIEHFDGSNHKALARKCGVSGPYVYQVLKDHRNEKRKSKLSEKGES